MGERRLFGEDDFNADSPRAPPPESLNASLGANNIPISKINDEMSSLVDIAEGSFGVVRRGKHDVDNCYYAVKQTKREISGEGDLQQRLQEVYVLSACSHPNILRYYDGWVEDKAAFIRTEFLADGSVGQFERPASEPLVISVLHQVASALHQLHSQGIIHRDVKPENILARRTRDGEGRGDPFIFKLCDFGLARPANGNVSPATGEVFKGINDDDGDSNYLCPEAFVACDALCVGPKADIYALGASCVDMMGGDAAAVRNGRYTYDPSLYSHPLRQLVARMTAADPDARPDAFDVTMETFPTHVRQESNVSERLTRIQELRAEVAKAKEAQRTTSRPS